MANASYRTRTSSAVACALLCSCLCLACNEQKPEVEIASSAPLASYAQGYPDEVEGTVTAFGEAEVSTKDLPGRFSAYPDEYEGDDVDYALIAAVLERADAVGRSRAYYERLNEVESVRTFYDEEREDIRRKVAGAAQHAAKQGGCEAEVGGAAAVTLDKAIEEKTEERLHEANDAHRLIDRHRNALGKKNAATLEKQVDEVSLAAYVAHIAIVEERIRLERLLEEAPEVKDTADQLIEAEQAYQEQPGRTDEEKKAATERIEAMREAKGRIDSVVRNAEKTRESMDQRVEKAQQQYDDALSKLLEALRSRAE